jgi:hypothetical protein
MTRFGLTLVVLAATASQGFAQVAAFTPALSCRAAAYIVVARGAVVLATTRDRYDRYVSNQGACSRDEDMKPAWVQSADNASCFIGYTCEHVYSNHR